MNKRTISTKYPYTRSLSNRKLNHSRFSTNVSCSTHLPSITKQTPTKIKQTILSDKTLTLSPYQYVPKRLPQSEHLFSKVIEQKTNGRQPKQRTLLDIKRELIKIIDQKRKEAINFRNSELQVKWQIEREAKKSIQNQCKRENSSLLYFRQQERRRLQQVLRKRKEEQNSFLEVGRRNMRDEPRVNSWTSQQFLKNEIRQLKSKLRSQCVNVLRQKESYSCIMSRRSLNPQD